MYLGGFLQVVLPFGANEQPGKMGCLELGDWDIGQTFEFIIDP